MTLALDSSARSTLPRIGSVWVTPARSRHTMVCLAGEHDLSTAPALADAFSHAIMFDSTNVLVDLSKVTFIDASTIAALMQLRNRLAEGSRTMTIHQPSACASRLLGICFGLRDLQDLTGPREN
jgi:anti-anti-sigma factor